MCPLQPRILDPSVPCGHGLDNLCPKATRCSAAVRATGCHFWSCTVMTLFRKIESSVEQVHPRGWVVFLGIRMRDVVLLMEYCVNLIL